MQGKKKVVLKAKAKAVKTIQGRRRLIVRENNGQKM